MILPAKGLLVVAYLNFRMPYLQIKILPTLHLKLYCFPYRQSHFVSFHSVSSNKFKHQPNTDTRRKPVSSAFFEYRCLCFQKQYHNKVPAQSLCRDFVSIKATAFILILFLNIMLGYFYFKYYYDPVLLTFSFQLILN